MSNLRKKRIDAGLTQKELAAMIRHKDGSKISHTSISNWENMVRVPPVDEMGQLAKILGCTVDELFHEFIYTDKIAG